VARGVPKMDRPADTLPRSRPQAWVSVETTQLLGIESQGGGWPGLRLLRCDIGWEVAPFTSLFLSPTITNLDRTLPRESNRLLQPTLSLPTHTCCSRLRSLMMDLHTSDPISGGEMGHLLSASRTTLRVIEIRPFAPPAIFPAIINLPRLQDLILWEPHLLDQIPPAVLPHFRTITLEGNHGPNLLEFEFFKGVPLKRLATVKVAQGGIVQFSTLLELLRGASATTHLEIDCVCQGPGQSGPCNFQLTDESIQDIGGALPRIRILFLVSCCRTSRITFMTLVRLSRACGDLKSLAIRVDFASVVDGSDRLNDGRPSLGVNGARPQRTMNGLGLLRLGNSLLPNTPRCEWVVVLALVSISPSIQSMFANCTGELGRRWGEVWRGIDTCRKTFRIAQVTSKHLSTYVGDSDADAFTSKVTPVP